jgi:DNA-binding transcriptional regulator YiaG
MEEEYNKMIGAKIREIRVSKGVTQGELGEFLGFTFQQVQKCSDSSFLRRMRQRK